MSDLIRVLQLGNSDWSKNYILPQGLEFVHEEVFLKVPKLLFDVVFIDRPIEEEEVEPLFQASKAHTVFVTDSVEINEALQWIMASKKGQILPQMEVQNFLNKEIRNYFPKPYGEKFNFNNMAIAQGFKGSVSWDGHYGVTVEGDFGPELSQIVFWRNNIPIFQGQGIDLWLEYEKDPSVEIKLVVTQFRSGSISGIQQTWEFSEEEMQDIVVVDNQLPTGPVFVSLQAKGVGKLTIIALHDRYSRRGHGLFLPGGKRHVTSKREEIFYYFDPGDLKPPLNVYFSGYKTMQGFEGYYMMKKMGCPFLLIAEPRLTGGAFYMGSAEYENAIVDIIMNTMEELGFSREDVILSGLSMGTYGALYYGCDIRPHAMILGKPLASIGDVAENERLHRPGGFPTSLDVLHYLTQDTGETAIAQLNDRFWDKFDGIDWGKSKFVVAYMIEDDYDSTAYDQIISHVNADGVQVYGKGIHGRHNDATGAIAGWFKSQYEQILCNDFARGEDEC